MLPERLPDHQRSAVTTALRIGAPQLLFHKLHSIEEFDAIGFEWDALDAQIHPRTPFTSRLWNALWWKNMRRAGFAVRDELRCYAVRDARGELIAVAPMMLSSRPGFGLLRVRELQFFGADANMTEIRGLVCRPEHTALVTSALLDTVRRENAGWGWAYFSGVRMFDADGGTSAPIPGLEWTRHVPCHFLRVDRPWDDFKSRLPRNMKEALRKCYNSLKRDGIGFKFEVVRNLEQCNQALADFFRLHSQRSACESAAVPHADIFCQPRARAFLGEYVRDMACADRLRVFQIRIGGQIAAMRIGFQFGDEVYLYYSGYDSRWRKYSLMTTVVAEAIRWCIEQQVAIVNLSTGTDPSKTRWRPEHTLHSEGVACAPGLSGRLAFLAGRALLPRLRCSSDRAGELPAQ